MTDKTLKAKRILKDIDFSSDNSHIALVSKEQGGPANGADYALVIKANKNITTDTIKKAQSITVNMEVCDFLRRFFGLWYDDAEILAGMLGFESTESESEDTLPSISITKAHEYIKSEIKSLDLFKAIEYKGFAEVMSTISESEYLGLLKDQSKIEKCFKSYIEKSKDTKPKKEDVMSTVEKSVYEELQKSAEKNKEELQKALEQISKFASLQKEQEEKSKFAELSAVIKDKGQAESIFKALKLVEDKTVFDEVIKSLKTLTELAENSELFVEKGVSTEGKGVKQEQEESAVAKEIKKQLKL